MRLTGTGHTAMPALVLLLFVAPVPVPDLPLAGGPLPVSGEKVPFATLVAGARSGIRAATTVAVRTPAEWRALWERHTQAASQRRMPPVDFARYMVVAVFAGEVHEPARLSITAVLRGADRLVVVFRVGALQPGPVLDDPKGSTATPFQIIRVGRSELPVVFVRAKTPDIY